MKTDPSVPQKIGPHRVIARIGHGRMGPVYLIRIQGAVDDGDLAVIQDLTATAQVASPLAPILFHQVERAAGLHHPNIARTYAATAEANAIYLVAEYIDGQPWSRARGRLWSDGQLRRRVHLSLLAEVLEGLEHAHEQQVVHGGLSPSNVFLTYDGQVKITKFGAARAIAASQLLAPDSFAHELVYLAPEQRQREALDRRTDVYAVGVMLWEALARTPLGHWPSDAIPAIDEIVPDVNPTLAAICSRALAPDPSQRYASAAAFRDDLLSQLPKTARAHHVAEAARLIAAAFASEREAIDAAIERERSRPVYALNPGATGPARTAPLPLELRLDARDSAQVQSLNAGPPLTSWLRSLAAIGTCVAVMGLVWIRNASAPTTALQRAEAAIDEAQASEAKPGGDVARGPDAHAPQAQAIPATSPAQHAPASGAADPPHAGADKRIGVEPSAAAAASPTPPQAAAPELAKPADSQPKQLEGASSDAARAASPAVHGEPTDQVTPAPAAPASPPISEAQPAQHASSMASPNPLPTPPTSAAASSMASPNPQPTPPTSAAASSMASPNPQPTPPTSAAASSTASPNPLPTPPTSAAASPTGSPNPLRPTAATQPAATQPVAQHGVTPAAPSTDAAPKATTSTQPAGGPSTAQPSAATASAAPRAAAAQAAPSVPAAPHLSASAAPKAAAAQAAPSVPAAPHLSAAAQPTPSPSAAAPQAAAARAPHPQPTAQGSSAATHPASSALAAQPAAASNPRAHATAPLNPPKPEARLAAAAKLEPAVQARTSAPAAKHDPQVATTLNEAAPNRSAAPRNDNAFDTRLPQRRPKQRTIYDEDPYR